MKKIVLFTFLMGVLIGYFLFTLAQKPGETMVVQASAQNRRCDNTVQVIQKTINAVVNISTTKKIKKNPFYSFNPFEDFFRQFFVPEPGYEATSLGSGVIIDKKGLVLTNEHVILSAESKITIILNDGREFEGKLVGSSMWLDLALLKIKIDGEVFPTIPLGDSDSIMVGETVISIGSPYAFSQTVTKGIISAKNRIISTGKKYLRGMIQTDASINPGNSGGPLLNMDGEVIGINSVIYSESGGSVGIGFAIPINKAKRIINDFLKYGRVSPIYVGIKVQPLSRRLARMMGVKEGVIIRKVVKGSPAYKAGLAEGDVIVNIDNGRVNDLDDYFSLMATYTINETIKFIIVRDREQEYFEFKPGELKIDMAEKVAWDLLGIQVVDNTRKIRFKYGLRVKQGVIIIKVKRNSYLGQTGVRPGHVLYQLGDTIIKNKMDYKKAILGISGRESAFIYIYVEGDIYRISVPLYDGW